MTEGRRGSADPQDGEPRVIRGGEPGAVEGPEAAGPAPAQPRREVERTRAGALWTAVAVGVLALIVILIFVVQNSGKVTIKFLAMDLTLPLGVALLVAALLGALLMLAIGTVRILQLRRLAKRPDLADQRRRGRRMG